MRLVHGWIRYSYTRNRGKSASFSNERVPFARRTYLQQKLPFFSCFRTSTHKLKKMQENKVPWEQEGEMNVRRAIITTAAWVVPPSEIMWRPSRG